MSVRPPFPWRTLFRLVAAGLSGKQLSFHAESRSTVCMLKRPLKVDGAEHIPACGPALLTINHYSPTGLPAWWITLAVSACVQPEIHWIITSAWTFPGRPRLQPLIPLTRWAFQRVARVYGFTNMPPMPPVPEDIEARAQAVRRVLRYAQENPNALIGIAPEGRDTPGGALELPARGTGRFLIQLARHGLPIYPVGMYAEGESMCLHFGPPYTLVTEPGLSPDERDHLASQMVMQSIAQLLPSHLRGPFVK